MAICKERRGKSHRHPLTAGHTENGFTNTWKFYETYITGDKWTWVVSLHKAWIYLIPTRTVFFSRERGGKDYLDIILKCTKSNFEKGFIVVVGFCAIGLLQITLLAPNQRCLLWILFLPVTSLGSMNQTKQTHL